jgi:hypothetical protein
MEEIQYNSSKIYRNEPPKTVKVKPMRDYDSFPLLSLDNPPIQGDLIAYKILELVNWNPEVVLKVIKMMSYN